MIAVYVFADHVEVGPRGGRSTRTIDRLRHALVWAQTGGEKAEAKHCTPQELLAVWQRLDDITERRLTYELEPSDDGGVTWITASGKRVSVTWIDIEGEPEEAA